MDWKEQAEEIAERACHIPQIKPEDVPELDLYMDQLVTFLDRHLRAVKRVEDAAFVTNTMINNYTKAKLIPPAVRKRYQRRHVLALGMVGQLKKVLSMQDLGKIAATAQQSEAEDTLYRLFLEAQECSTARSRELMGEAVERCEAAGLAGNTALAVLAVQLAAEAQCRTLLAEQLLDAMEPMKTEEGRKKNKA